jgi:hypothetical protein
MSLFQGGTPEDLPVNSPDAMVRESLVEYVKELLPDPIRESEGLDGALTMVGGDPGEVIVRLTADDVSVSLFSVQWDGPHTPRVLPRPFASLVWSQIPAASLMMAIHALVAAASEVRRSSYSVCERCGKTKPPEWMHGESICRSCAERELGVVH